MKPGETIYLKGYPFQYETQQDDGYTVFVRTNDEAAKAYADEVKRTGDWVSFEGNFHPTTGRIMALQDSKTGALRVKLELSESVHELSFAWPRAG